MIEEPRNALQAAHVDRAAERVVAAVMAGAARAVHVDGVVPQQRLQDGELPVARQVVRGVVVAQAGAPFEQQVDDHAIVRPARLIERRGRIGAVFQQEPGRGQAVPIAARLAAGAVLQRQPGAVARVGIGPRGRCRGIGQHGGRPPVIRDRARRIQVDVARNPLQQRRQVLRAAHGGHGHRAHQVVAAAQHRVGAVLQQQPQRLRMAGGLGSGLLELHRTVQRPVVVRGGRQHVDVGALVDQERDYLRMTPVAGVHQHLPVAGDLRVGRDRRPNRLQVAPAGGSRRLLRRRLVHGGERTRITAAPKHPRPARRNRSGFQASGARALPFER